MNPSMTNINVQSREQRGSIRQLKKHFARMNKIIYTLLLLLGITGGPIVAQNIDLAHLKNLFGKGNPLKINGGVSASTILYNGNDGSGRSPFAWFINGNLNLNILGQVNLPFSFNFTNTGSGYSYPTVPNRLSLHPSYKWVTGHIGDVSMTFSPYTLSGYQFTGVGVDLTPEGPFKFSAMYGRLQKAVEMDTVNHTTLAAYRRMGYGAKITFQQPLYTLGMIVFAARDDTVRRICHQRPDPGCPRHYGPWSRRR